MDITKEVHEIISELQEDVTEKQKEIAIIKATDFSKPIDLKTWDKLCKTTVFKWLGKNNIATEVVKQIFPEAKELYNNPNDVSFKINGFICFLSKLGDGLETNVTWYEKIKPRTFNQWCVHSEDYMVKNYFKYIMPYFKLKKPTVHNKVRLYMKRCYRGRGIWNYFIYVSNYMAIKKAIDRDFLNGIEKQMKDAYEQYLKRCEEKSKELDEKLIKFRLEVIPVLERFSKYIGTDMTHRRSIFQTFPTVEELNKKADKLIEEKGIS